MDDAPSRSSSVYSREQDDRINVVPSLYGPSIFDQRTERRFEASLTSANRLLCAGGFQKRIIEAVWVLHVELRPVLRVGGRESTIAKIDYCCNLLIKTLGTWAGRNRALSDDISKVNLDTLRQISQTSSEGCSHAIRELKKAIPTFPSIAGCAQNVATISMFQLYFAEEIDFNFTPAGSTPEKISHLFPAERHMRTLLLRLRDCFNEAKATAKVLLDDGTAVWQEFGNNNAMGPRMALDSPRLPTVPSPRPSPDKDLRTEHGAERKRDKAIKKLGALFKGKGKEKEEEEKPSSMKISAPFNAQHLVGLTKPGTNPSLDALPAAPLRTLQERQKEIQQQFARPRQDSSAGRKTQTSQEEHTSPDRHQTHGFATRDVATAESSLASAMAGASIYDEEDFDCELNPERRKSCWRKKTLADLEGGRRGE
ncbi:hypothetical protein IWZ03DRAFT_356990 [Phyllosticta citriasiana]|uniref:Uncharacterized protein n=1 Tax=Phyllosticta citriasiana TaxID=595635 RepID=A0ABR1L139_9PEZI